MEPFVTLRVLYPLKRLLANEPATLALLQEQFGLNFNVPDLNATLPSHQYAKLLEWLVEHRHPFVVFEIARKMDVGTFGVFDYYLQACESVGEALTEFFRFHAVVMQRIPSVEIKLDERFVSLSIKETFPDGSVVENSRVNFLYAILIRWLQLLTDNDELLPSRADSNMSQRFPLAYYQTWVTPELKFDCPVSALYYPKSLWSLRLRNANPRMKALLFPEVKAEHDKLMRTQSLVQQVIAAIAAVGFVRADQANISEHLGMAESTLKRKLKEEEQTFSALLAQAKQEQAIRRLCESDEKIETIALELGFAERASFERAFRQWVGMSPVQFRRDAGRPVLQFSKGLHNIDQLPPLSRAAQQQLVVALDEKIASKQLIEVVGKDPFLSARILVLANSPRYGAGRVKDLPDAINRFLGTREVQRLLLAMVASESFATDQNRDMLQAFWLNTLLLQACLKKRQTGRELAPADADTLSTVALLKNIGLLLVSIEQPDAMRQLAQDATGIKDHAALLAKEQAMWGLSRYLLAHHVLLRWQLPSVLASQVRALDPEFAGEAPNPAINAALLPLVQLVDLYVLGRDISGGDATVNANRGNSDDSISPACVQALAALVPTESERDLWWQWLAEQTEQCREQARLLMS